MQLVNVPVLVLVCTVHVLPALGYPQEAFGLVKSRRVERSAQADENPAEDKRYQGTVLFGKRLFKLGRREDPNLADEADEYEKRWYGAKMPVSDSQEEKRGHYPRTHLALQNLMERENRKFYFGKRDDEMQNEEDKRAKTFFFGKRPHNMEDEKRKMVYFGKRDQERR